MAERRRQTRPLSQTPTTELELLWETREAIAVLEERVQNHLDDHDKISRQLVSAKSLRWTNLGVVALIATDVILHFTGGK